MHLTLQYKEKGKKVGVSCDGVGSHSFDLAPLQLDLSHIDHIPPELTQPAKYGLSLYDALFPEGSKARGCLEDERERLILGLEDNTLQEIPWEYVYGPDGFLVADYHVVRSLPSDKQVSLPTTPGPLHILGIPSDPLVPPSSGTTQIEQLDVAGEWQRLREVIKETERGTVLERVHPPTLEQLIQQINEGRGNVVHFMGHGSQGTSGATLFFENQQGGLDEVSAVDIVRALRGRAFFVTLNACVSARPGPTVLSNLAAALVAWGIPYVLGMQFVVGDEDARILSRLLYSSLARGQSVEEAMRQARVVLARSSQNAWAVGVPVLYTSLTEPEGGLETSVGQPQILEHHRPIDPGIELILPRAEGTFRGRTSALLFLGEKLTADNPPALLTIHGVGGQGKSRLARQAIERFAHAFPSGVWGASLEGPPTRQDLAADLAQFLGVPTEGILEPEEVERQLFARLGHRRLLLVLDNAETFVAAAERGEKGAQQLADLLQRLKATPLVTLLVTSRAWLGWEDEKLELEGLDAQAGALLFRQSAPQRKELIEMEAAHALSLRLGGHPLSLRLLGGAFNNSPLSLPAFIKELEGHLADAEDHFKEEDDRHRSLYACMEYSVRDLDDSLRDLLSSLWVFQAPFFPDAAGAVFAPEGESGESEDVTTEDPEGETSPISRQLHTLWHWGLLEQEQEVLPEGSFLLYRLPPVLRPYARHQLPQVHSEDKLLARYGTACAWTANLVEQLMGRGRAGAYLARTLRADLEQGWQHAGGKTRIRYLLDWGQVQARLGETAQGLALVVQALELAEGRQQSLALRAMNSMALIYSEIGRPKKALALFEQILPIRRQVSDHAGEATTLGNMAAVYHAAGQPEKAYHLFEQALTIHRKVGDRAGEATTLNNMGMVYQATGQPRKALNLFQQILPIRRQVGDRAGEAITLGNMATVYQNTGHLEEALAFFQQALSITREVGVRTLEAGTLNNIGLVYQDTGQLEKALDFFEQAVPIHREVGDRTGDRAGEVVTLNNIASVCHATGRAEDALDLFQQVLSITREVGDRTGEAGTVTDIGAVYRATGRPKEALAFFKQALSITREVGDHAGEANILNNMALVYTDTGHLEETLAFFKQALSITREVGDRAGEAVTLTNTARVYRATGRPEEALDLYQQALPITNEVGDRAGEVVTLWNLADLLYRSLARQGAAVARMRQAVTLFEEGLAHDAAGNTVEAYLQRLAQMQRGEPLGGGNTIAQEQAEQQGADTTPGLPFPEDVIPRTVTALRGGPQERMAHAQYLAQLNLPDDDLELQAFLTAIQTALFGGNLTVLERDLQGVYRQVWQAIRANVEAEVDPALLNVIIQNTLAVLGPAADRREEWETALHQLQSEHADNPRMLALLAAVLALLAAGGQPAGLGQDLEGIYAQTWQAIVENLRARE